MIKFTNIPTIEEINLCKQVAEKWKKPIVFGIWFHDLEDPEHLPFLWCNLTDELKRESAIPLWTISDCLQFLEDLGAKAGTPELWQGGRSLKWYCRNEYSKVQEGKTPLEACLKAVLAVPKEEKK